MKYQEYLQSEYWNAVSKAVKGRANYKCQVCNSPHDLNAHHRTYDHRGHEMEHLDDLVCLCRRCHGVFHGKIEPPAPVKEVKIERPKKNRRLIDYAQVQNDMPADDGKPLILDHNLVIRLRTEKYGFTNATLRAIGIKYPLIAGWVHRLNGTVITRDQYRAALEGRYIFNSGKLDRETAPISA
jgi:hypothetical protein